MKRLVLITAVIGVSTGLYETATACSTFYITGGGCSILGRNYDWHIGNGLVLVNRKGITKTAISYSKPARWTSRYGSVTFNQYGREFPCGGMNESGLVIAMLWLDESEYPQPDRRHSVNVFQWVQYQLDTASKVAEVIASDRKIRIQPVSSARVHFFVGDADGQCASIEFIDRKLVCHTGSSFSDKVLTNSTYKDSVAQLKKQGRTATATDNSQTPSRFVRAARRLDGYSGTAPAIDDAFNILKEISQGDYTKWSLVYDIARRTIHFRTLDAGEIRIVDLRKMDFTTAAPCKMLDVNVKLAGEVTSKFVPYSHKRNRDLVSTSIAATSIAKDLPKAIVDIVANYPETCLATSTQEPAAAGSR